MMIGILFIAAMITMVLSARFIDVWSVKLFRTEKIPVIGVLAILVGYCVVGCGGFLGLLLLVNFISNKL